MIPGSSFIRRIHITELRERIDALRLQFALAGFPWTDSTLAAGRTTIQSQHIADLRAALSQVYVAARLTPPIYTDLMIAPGITVKAVHIIEIRGNVISLELR